MRNWWRRRLASSWLTSSRTVISRSRVISSATDWPGLVAKRTSRLVRMPTSLPREPFGPRSTTGMPEMRCSFIVVKASASVSSGWIVIGFSTMPDSYFLTRRTCSACSCGSRLRWITPIPPFCAMAMAIGASVTVSMAEETIGRCRRIERVSRVATSTSVGITEEAAGRSRTSSKVRPSMMESALRKAMHQLRRSTGALKGGRAAALSSWHVPLSCGCGARKDVMPQRETRGPA